MKIIAGRIGRVKSKELESILRDFEKRSKRYVPFEWTVYQDEKTILKQLETTPTFLCLLEIEGKRYSTEQAAEWLEKILSSAQYKKAIFLIGDSYGFSKEMKSKTHHQWSFSPLTFTSDLTSLLLCEQLYRIGSFLKGSPYHHG